jgi:hypothetical protein
VGAPLQLKAILIQNQRSNQVTSRRLPTSLAIRRRTTEKSAFWRVFSRDHWRDRFDAGCISRQHVSAAALVRRRQALGPNRVVLMSGEYQTSAGVCVPKYCPPNARSRRRRTRGRCRGRACPPSTRNSATAMIGARRALSDTHLAAGRSACERSAPAPCKLKVRRNLRGLLLGTGGGCWCAIEQNRQEPESCTA